MRPEPLNWIWLANQAKVILSTPPTDIWPEHVACVMHQGCAKLAAVSPAWGVGEVRSVFAHEPCVGPERVEANRALTSQNL